MNPRKASFLQRLFVKNRVGGHPLAMEPADTLEDPGLPDHDHDGDAHGHGNGNGHGHGHEHHEPEGASAAGGLSFSRLSRKEETALRIQEGFQDLSSLLKGIGTKLETQNTRHADLSEHVKPLPGLLSRLSDQMDAQRDASLGLQKTLSGLETVARDQASFLRTLDENHRETVHSFQRAQKSALRTFYKAQKETYEAFRSSQDNQSRQFKDILIRTQRSFTRLLVIFLVAILVAVSAAVIIGRGPAGTPGETGVETSAIERVDVPLDSE